MNLTTIEKEVLFDYLVDFQNGFRSERVDFSKEKLRSNEIDSGMIKLVFESGKVLIVDAISLKHHVEKAGLSLIEMFAPKKYLYQLTTGDVKEYFFVIAENKPQAVELAIQKSVEEGEKYDFEEDDIVMEIAVLPSNKIGVVEYINAEKLAY